MRKYAREKAKFESNSSVDDLHWETKTYELKRSI